MAAKGLSQEQNERVRAIVRELLKAEDQNQVQLAKKLGVTQSAISSFISGRQGTSYVLVERIAKLANKSEWEILGKQPPSLFKTPREIAAELAREHGVDEHAIASVMAEEITPENRQRSTLWWADRMRWRERDILAPSAVTQPVPKHEEERKAPEKSSEMRVKRRAGHG